MKMKPNKKKIFGVVLTSIYILLMMIALFSSEFMGLPSVLIFIGCLLSLTYMLILRHKNFLLLIIAGMVCLSISAILIGIQQDSTQISHHIIRTIFEIIIVMLFLPLQSKRLGAYKKNDVRNK